MEELILENKECGAAGDANQEQQDYRHEDYFCPALLLANNRQRLAAFRALGIGWHWNLLAGIGKTAADLIFADAERRFHRAFTIIRANGAELRKILTIEPIEKMS
jgi:hypothetical protein